MKTLLKLKWIWCNSHGMNTCMAQLPGKCENALIRPSCLDGSSSGMQSEINQREWTKSTTGAVEGNDDMLIKYR